MASSEFTLHDRRPIPQCQQELAVEGMEPGDGKPGAEGLLKKPPLVILSAAKNLRDDDSTRVRRPFTSFRVT